MLNKLLTMIREYDMIVPGDRVICAFSGGPDSAALLFALHLLKEKLGIRLEAAHFNHHLRGEESRRDEEFVRSFCDQYDIPLYVGEARVTAGKKGLEAAARDARYGFLRSLPGKIATAHTADDNAETVILHLIRGTGLKGLGGIPPVSGNVIRPMLLVTRQQVEAFLEEYHLPSVLDSSNQGDLFLRNRIRHGIMPLLRQENPRIGENFSTMALRLREDADFLGNAAEQFRTLETEKLKNLHPALRSRVLESFLKENGVREPEAQHIAQAERLLYTDRPSARIRFPGNVTVIREYGILRVLEKTGVPAEQVLPCPGKVRFGNYWISCSPADTPEAEPGSVTVQPQGKIRVRSRQAGDRIRLPGGSKSLRRLFIDRKIPEPERMLLPVLADDLGILAAAKIGINLDRAAQSLPAVRIQMIEDPEKNTD